MKTLVLNGSPRKNGDTITLINEMKLYLDGDVDMLSAYHDGINPCIDCRFCLENTFCIYTDAMQRVLDDLDSYDNIIIASPLYFSELTGALLNMCSRFQLHYVARFFRGVKKKTTRKNGVIILVGGGDKRIEPAMSTAKILLGHLNANHLETVLALNTNNIPSKDDKVAMDKAKEIALLLNYS